MLKKGVSLPLGGLKKLLESILVGRIFGNLLKKAYEAGNSLLERRVRHLRTFSHPCAVEQTATKLGRYLRNAFVPDASEQAKKAATVRRRAVVGVGAVRRPPTAVAVWAWSCTPLLVKGVHN